jgi:hypothetical protein
MFPPRQGSAFDSWKRKSTGANVARRLWEQRQRLRQEYEAVHGTNLARWPVRHPGVVLDAVQWVAQPACLGCTWFDEVGVSMKKPDWLDEATERARRHQDSNGAPWTFGQSAR